MFFDTENVALKKPAFQVGTEGGYGAIRAVDGMDNQTMESGECAFPTIKYLGEISRNVPVWWIVDLTNHDPRNLFLIVNVTIYFRSDCCRRYHIYVN